MIQDTLTARSSLAVNSTHGTVSKPLYLVLMLVTSVNLLYSL